MSTQMRNFILFILSFSVLSPAFGEIKQQSREQRVDTYLQEFCSPVLKAQYPHIYSAIKNVLNVLPDYAFEKAVEREFPAVFLEVPHYGASPWADSIAIIQDPKDPVAFTKGIWIVQLNIALNKAKDIEAIEGIVFHELAHKVLGHQSGLFSKEIEKQTNRQVKKWGFKRQYLKAKDAFGSKSIHP